MSLSCYCDAGDCDWYYEAENDFSVLDTKRGRRCCSCDAKIATGAEVLKFRRYRSPSNDIEESIYNDEVPLAPWFMCETCGGLYMAVEDLGMCCDIRENIPKQIKDYREMEEYHKRRAAR